MATEYDIKSKRLSEFLDRHHLDGVLLTLRSNFAWITCGRDNRISNSSPVGVAGILASKDGKRVCITNTIEAPRMKQEELAGLDIDVVSFPWWDNDTRRKTAEQLIAGRKIACDSESYGLPLTGLPGRFNELRWSLTDEEIARYRDGARRASAAMEKACRALRPGMTEHDAAAVLDSEIRINTLNPIVTLVSSDDRLPKFRHPIPKDRKFSRYVMLVTCAEFGGLISCLTRFVRFAKPSHDEQAKQQAVCNIDAAVNLATRPGRTLGEIFDDLRRAYADNGYADEWQNHHQGGSTGYAPREALGVPGSSIKALANQAFAWNPSVVGAKSEDSTLCTSNGIEVLTAHSNDWPSVEGHSAAGDLRRPDVLVL